MAIPAPYVLLALSIVDKSLDLVYDFVAIDKKCQRRLFNARKKLTETVELQDRYLNLLQNAITLKNEKDVKEFQQIYNYYTKLAEYYNNLVISYENKK